MKNYFEHKLKLAKEELQTIDIESHNISITETKTIIEYLNNLLKTSRTYLISMKSITTEDEIFFFKSIKPQILGHLLYFNKVNTIQLKHPNGSNETIRSYYELELESLNFFFKRNLDFYQYYRSSASHMDEYYFVRNQNINDLCTDSVHYIMDKEFSTTYCYKTAKIICNEMLRSYLNKKIIDADKQLILNHTRTTFTINSLNWTGPLVALVELGYSLDSIKYINNGKADLKEIMLGLETLFNVDLGDYYRTFYSIKTREEQTKYLNKMCEQLKKRIEVEESKG